MVTRNVHHGAASPAWSRGTLLPFLQLARAPGAVTAAGNVLAGAWLVTGGALTAPVAAAAFGAVLLYAGGVTFNDYFDRELDRSERSARPIPSGRVTEGAARTFALTLTALGAGLAALAGWWALGVAALIVAFTFTYNTRAKHHALAGPVNMGVLRALTFILGLSLVPGAAFTRAPLALAYVAFVMGITVASEGEVAGASRARLAAAGALFAGAVALAAGLASREALAWHAAPFLALLVVVPAIALARAFARPEPERVEGVVLAGVMSIAFLDAAYAAAGAGWPYGAALAALVPVAWGLARVVPVT